MFTPAMAVLAVICEPILFGFDGARFPDRFPMALCSFLSVVTATTRRGRRLCLTELFRHVVFLTSLRLRRQTHPVPVENAGKRAGVQSAN